MAEGIHSTCWNQDMGVQPRLTRSINLGCQNPRTLLKHILKVISNKRLESFPKTIL